MQMIVVLFQGIGLGIAAIIAIMTIGLAVRILFYSRESNMRLFRIDPSSIEKRPRMPK